MVEQEWAVVEEIAGSFQADILKGLLEAQEIPVMVSKPGAGSAIGITMGVLGRVQILVPRTDLERAKQVVSDYYSGEYEDQELIDLKDEPVPPEGEAPEG